MPPIGGREVALVVRPAVRDDVEPLAQLIENIETYYEASRIQPFEERTAQVPGVLFSDPPLAHALLAVDDEETVVGLAAYSFLWPVSGSTHSVFLKELDVVPGSSRKGVGTALMCALRDLAAARPGCGRLERMTDAPNESARAFYGRMGFAESANKVVYRMEAA
jgi:GNAT superfamily N-acetyltransferase